MTRVHCLEHVQRLGTTAFADDDPLGPHTQGVSHQVGGGNFGATLRDYGRLGLFVLRDGMIGNERVLPAGWRDLAGRPDTALTAPGRLYDGYPLGYGYHWWSLPGTSAFTGQGIYGQFLFIDTDEQVVAVVWGAWNEPNDGEAEMETYALLDAAVRALR